MELCTWKILDDALIALMIVINFILTLTTPLGRKKNKKFVNNSSTN